MRLSCGWHMHAHVHVHACVFISFLYWRWKHSRIYASLMCMTVSVFCLSTFMSMHDSCQHTRAHTCRDHSHTLERWWWRVWRWVALAPHTILHTNLQTCVCMCVCIYMFFVSLLACVYTRAFCLTLFSSSIQGSFVGQQPAAVRIDQCPAAEHTIVLRWSRHVHIHTVDRGLWQLHLQRRLRRCAARPHRLLPHASWRTESSD